MTEKQCQMWYMMLAYWDIIWTYLQIVQQICLTNLFNVGITTQMIDQVLVNWFASFKPSLTTLNQIQINITSFIHHIYVHTKIWKNVLHQKIHLVLGLLLKIVWTLFTMKELGIVIEREISRRVKKTFFN